MPSVCSAYEQVGGSGEKAEADKQDGETEASFRLGSSGFDVAALCRCGDGFAAGFEG